MSITRTSFWLALFTLAGLVPQVHAQHYHPFIEPGRFNPDYQFFAPADIEDYGDDLEPNTGWFGSYARTYIWMTRPERLRQINDDSVNPLVENFGVPDNQTIADPTDGDFTWGNRFDIGYMTEEDTGWLFVAWHIDGPQANDELIVERLNRANEDDPPIVPPIDANNPITQARSYILQNSINVADLSGFELNKLYRQDRLHSGGWLEPFLGFRYIKFIDFWQRDVYERFDIEGNRLPPLPPPPDPLADPTTALVEQLTSARSGFVNHMVGGQLGLRWFQQENHWLLSSEMRAFAFQNFQSLEIQVDAERTIYDDIGLDEDVAAIFFQRDRAAYNQNEFVYGTEIRAEAAYQLTREIYLHFGMNFMHFPQGIGRGPLPEQNEQDLTLVGATFGASINR